jgi:hypothetical protein
MNQFYDDSGDPISESDIQFILSLAPREKLKLIESELVFVEDKLDHDLHLARSKQLKLSIEASKASGQYKLYETIYKPAIFALNNCPPMKISGEAQESINTMIDDFVNYLNSKKEILDCFGKQWYHPANEPQTKILMKSFSMDNDPYKNLYKEEYAGIIQAICLVLDLCDKTPYIMPEGFLIKSIPIPTWKPNLSLMQSDAFSLGHFTGPCEQFFYTPECKKSVSSAPSSIAMFEAKSQMILARKSMLPAYSLIVSKKLIPIRVSTHTKTIIHLEPK